MPDLTLELATEVKRKALVAVQELNSIVGLLHDRCSQDESDAIRRGVGLSIGRIQTELLDPVYALFPEIDDLK